MAQIHFDDTKLINLARFNYFASKDKLADPNEQLENLFQKEELNNADRNLLLDFLDKTKQTKPLSVKTMKDEIFAIIGYKSDNYWGTVNRPELEAIYKHIIGTRK